MVDSIKYSLDKGNIVCGVFMDLSPDFDCVPYKLLIAKFRVYDVSVSVCDIITSFLTDRRQCVKIENQRSEWIHSHKGSSQGSMFGRFSYNVLTIDMFDLIDEDVEIYHYADDNTACLNKIKINI